VAAVALLACEMFLTRFTIAFGGGVRVLVSQAGFATVDLA